MNDRKRYKNQIPILKEVGIFLYRSSNIIVFLLFDGITSNIYFPAQIDKTEESEDTRV